MVVAEKRYTASEFWEVAADFSSEYDYELIDGVIVEMPPSSKQNSYIAGKILRLLGNFVAEKQLGYVFGADGGYDVSKFNVQIPDVSYLSKDRAPKLPDDNVVPANLVVGVILPSETSRRIHQKTERYLQAGVDCVWNMYPDEKIVEVWTLTQDDKLTFETLTDADMLRGDADLSGFKLIVSEIFTL